MSRKTLKKYNTYHREILAEFLPEEVLKWIDELYTQAKLKRAKRRIEK